MKSNTLLTLCLLSVLGGGAGMLRAAEFFVSPAGDDLNPGTSEKPLATLRRARDAVREARRAEPQPVTVWLRGGTYYLPETLVLGPEDSGSREAPVVYAAAPGQRPVLSGAVRLTPRWKPAGGGCVEAATPPGLAFDLLFVGGKRQDLARFPNRNPAMPTLGCFPDIHDLRARASITADALAPERVARWADPAGGFVHALHGSFWGGNHWRITGKTRDGKLTLEGGRANNRGDSMHPVFRYVEGIAEELDAPGEWFLDVKRHVLRFLPPAGLDLAGATVEAARLRHLVEFAGTADRPVRFITLRGLTFRHAARTFLQTAEPMLMSDWTIYRGGAVLFDGAEDCALDDATLEDLGGNAVCVSRYNRRVAVRRSLMRNCGAGGVVFVGDRQTVRGVKSWQDHLDPATMDRTPGPKGDNYPADCLVDDCLITHLGIDEKQIAGVNIDVAARITVRRCSIYDLPRAGINIGDGCWGGHVVEGCDVFDTVRESDDHGSFNSWGRDRYWTVGDAREKKLLARLDVIEPITLRNSRWRCDHGWDIDLDDGSSNYVITNNLLLAGGLKLREGFFRTVTNNVIVNNSLHPHVWFPASGDVFRHNIVFSAYRPAGMTVARWGQEIDWNLFAGGDSDRRRFAPQGCDKNSAAADPQFVDPAKGDFRVRSGSPALGLGFRNFAMDRFGVQAPRLRALAKTPAIPRCPPR